MMAKYKKHSKVTWKDDSDEVTICAIFDEDDDDGYYYDGFDFIAPIEGEENYEKALESTGFGKFHYALLTICGLIYMNTAMGITIISFVLPSATCDFQMNSTDKGWLTAAPMLGMVIGSYFWGCLADTKGRKVVLILTLFIDGICGVLSSVAQVYWLFMLLRFVNGFAITGAMGICFPYLGEFQPTKHRETILCWMELFWTFGVILLPAIAWIIIPMDIAYNTDSFFYKSWNLFITACSLPSLFIAFWLYFFPESPKFLFECGEPIKSLDVLKMMYSLNTGNNPETFPIISLKEKKRNQSVISQVSVRSLRVTKPKELKMLFQEISSQTKALFRYPHLKYTVITCMIQFGVTASYYTLMLWFPELFNRFEEFELFHPGKKATVCEVSSVVVTNSTLERDALCEAQIGDSVFLHTLIIGLACLPTSLLLPLCVHRLGAKFFLVCSIIIAGIVTIGLYFVNSTSSNLILSCVFEALTSLAISTVYCVMVDLFPTNLRVMAAALSLTFGRIGGLLGNLVFGFLIDLHCEIPIALFAVMLLGSGLLCLILPRTGKSELD